MNNDRRVFLPGLAAGFVGATTLALWFLILDSVAGDPFQTPAFLARVFLGLDTAEIIPGLLVLFTLIHYLVFLALGVFASWIVGILPRIPTLLLGTVAGFLLFDLVFYGAVLTTGASVGEELGWGSVLVGNLLAGVALAGILYLMGDRRAASWWESLRTNAVLREGIWAGLAGAAIVAVWFLLLDLLRGETLLTPAALGSALFLGARSLAQVTVEPAIIVGYTVVHVAVFSLLGIAIAAVLERARRAPHILLAAVLFFFVAEALFMGFLAIAAEFLLQAMTWWAIAVGNLLAAVLMGLYFARRHPELKSVLDGTALGWTEQGGDQA